MAEIKDGKIIFSSEEQPLVDKLINERVSREKQKYDEMNVKYNQLKTTLNEIETAKNDSNKALNDNLKKMEKLQTELKALGIEKENFKEFQKEYEATKLIAEKYNQEKMVKAQKNAFIEAGGNADKFDKALRLVTFKDTEGNDVDPKTAFAELLKDDDFSILRKEVIDDPNKGDQGAVPPKPEDEVNESKGWASLLFKK